VFSPLFSALGPEPIKARMTIGVAKALIVSIINYAAARRSAEPISTAPTESAVHRLLHRRMTAKQQMRWPPRGAHFMLKVRTAVMNGTFERDHIALAQTTRCLRRRAA